MAVTGKAGGRCDGASFQILGGITGEITIQVGHFTEQLRPGEFALLPAALGDYQLGTVGASAKILRVSVPKE